MFCTNCGGWIDEGSKYCPHCGTAVRLAKTTYNRIRNDDRRDAWKTVDLRQAADDLGKRTNEAIADFADQLDSYTGGEGHVNLRFSKFFSNVFRSHSREEIEEIFACGSKSTTPSLRDVAGEWPEPWYYSRAFLAMLVTFILMLLMWMVFGGQNALPGVMITGAMLVPVPILIFYFECNSLRNVSFILVLEMFFVGGAMSMVFTFLISVILPGGIGSFIPSMITGLVEEIAKALVICMFIKRLPDKRFILDGLLIGGAVGAGFSVFETAGYIFGSSLLFTGDGIVVDTKSMLMVIIVRSLLAFGGHVAWAAVTGAAVMIALDHEIYSWAVLTRGPFLRIFIFNVMLHGLWDTTIFPNEILEFIKGIFLGVIIWIIIGIMLNRGLREIRSIR